MKKSIVTLLFLVALGQVSLLAEENVETQGHTGKTEKYYYIIPKVIHIEGDTNVHEGVTMVGESGYGLGIDIGYHFTKHFSAELATSYAKNQVEEDTLHDAKYITYGLDLAYTKHLASHIGLLVKGGYGYEEETIDTLNIDETGNGFTAALGLEYEVNKHLELVLEFEHAFIDGTRGEAYSIGSQYKF